MSEAEMRADFSGWMNGMGLVDNRPSGNGNSGNSPLFHAHYVWTMVRQGYWQQSDTRATLAAVQGHLEVEPGLFRRAGPGCDYFDDQEGPDDFIGMASMQAAVPSLPFATQMLEYGRRVRVPLRDVLRLEYDPIVSFFLGWIRLSYVFNNKIPGELTEFTVWPNKKANWSAWFGRQPQLIAHLQFCAREALPRWRPFLTLALLPVYVALCLSLGWWNLVAVPFFGLLIAGTAFGFRRLWWALTIWATARFTDKNGQDPWILSWHLVMAYRASGFKSIPCEWASKNYMERLFTRWPGGLNSVLLKYFGEGNPISRWFVS